MSTPQRGPRGSVGALIEEVRFARDSPVEGGVTSELVSEIEFASLAK